MLTGDQHKEEQSVALNHKREQLVAKIHEVFGRGSRGGLQMSGASINKFDLIKQFPGRTLHGSMNVSCDSQIIRVQFVKTFSTARLARGGTLEFHDLFAVCCFPVTTDFGRSIIRTETIGDKIAELFVPCEHDFEEYRYFSWKYCCFSSEPEKLRAALNEEITELFIEHDEDIAVEFNSKYCVVKIYHSIRKPKQVLHMIAFALKLRQLLS